MCKGMEPPPGPHGKVFDRLPMAAAAEFSARPWTVSFPCREVATSSMLVPAYGGGHLLPAPPPRLRKVSIGTSLKEEW